jgi:hypothetical protein
VLSVGRAVDDIDEGANDWRREAISLNGVVKSILDPSLKPSSFSYNTANNIKNQNNGVTLLGNLAK